MDSRARLLISIRPRFARAIFAGKKRVELRKVRPNLGSLDQVLFYSTLPEASITGSATVATMIEAPLNVLWKRIGNVSGLSYHEFFDYFGSRSHGFAIVLESPAMLANPISLAELRKLHHCFAPPQSYWYLRRARLPDRRLLDEFDARSQLGHRRKSRLVAV